MGSSAVKNGPNRRIHRCSATAAESINPAAAAIAAVVFSDLLVATWCSTMPNGTTTSVTFVPSCACCRFGLTPWIAASSRQFGGRCASIIHRPVAGEVQVAACGVIHAPIQILRSHVGNCPAYASGAIKSFSQLRRFTVPCQRGGAVRRSRVRPT